MACIRKKWLGTTLDVSIQAQVALPWGCTTRTAPSRTSPTAPSRWLWPKSGFSTSAPRTPSWRSTTVASKTSSRRSTRSKDFEITRSLTYTLVYQRSQLMRAVHLLACVQGIPGQVRGQGHLVRAPSDRRHGGPGHEIRGRLHLGLQELRRGRSVGLCGTRSVRATRSQEVLWINNVETFLELWQNCIGMNDDK